MMETEQKETLSSTVTMASLLPSSSQNYGQGVEDLSTQFQEQDSYCGISEADGLEADYEEVAAADHQPQVTGVKREWSEAQDSQVSGQSVESSSLDENASSLAPTSNSKKPKVSKPRGRKPKGEKVERKPTKRIKKEVETPPKVKPEVELQDEYVEASTNQEVPDFDNQQSTEERVSLSEETFEAEDPSQLYYSMNTSYEEGNSSTLSIDQDLEQMSSSVGDKNDQILVQSHPEEAETADTGPTENQDGVFEEKTEGKIENGKRYVCEFEGCNKSYTQKANRGTHQKKAHGLLGSRAAKKQRLSVSVAEEDLNEVSSRGTGQNELVEAEAEEPNAESLTNPLPSEYANYSETFEATAASVLGTDNNDPAPTADNEKEELGPISSFLTDTSLGFDAPDNDVFQNQESSTNEREEGLSKDEASHQSNTEDSNTAEAEKEAEVDVSTSKYFQKNPKMMQTAREKSCLLFTEMSDHLPTGWTFRSVEVTNKVTLEKSMSRHYLSPERKVLKTGLAVIEYLRLKGNVDYEALEVTAQNLNVPDQKFKSLFNINQ